MAHGGGKEVGAEEEARGLGAVVVGWGVGGVGGDEGGEVGDGGGDGGGGGAWGVEG